jgi:hypothetical protein
MNRQIKSKLEVAEFLKTTLGSADQAPVDYRWPFQMMERVKNPDDIEAAIAEMFESLDCVKKKKERLDTHRIWWFSVLIVMILCVVTIKNLLWIVIFSSCIIIAALFFSKVQKSISPLILEVEAHKSVLLELLKINIMNRLKVTND